MLDNLAANWPYLVLLGLTGGFASALLGIGGGVIIVPMLVFIASASQREAQGLSLGYMIVTALTGFLLYKYTSKEHLRLDYFTVGLLTVGGILGAFCGQYAASHIDRFWLRKIFAIFMLVVAVMMIRERRKKEEVAPPPTKETAANLIVEASADEIK